MLTGNLQGVRKGCVIAFGNLNQTTQTEQLIIAAETPLLTAQEKKLLLTEIEKTLATNLNIRADEIILVPSGTLPKTSSGKLKRVACQKAWLAGTLKKPRRSTSRQFIRLCPVF